MIVRALLVGLLLLLPNVVWAQTPTVTHLLTNGTANNQTIYATASTTCHANCLCLANFRGGAISTTVPLPSIGGTMTGTWDLITSQGLGTPERKLHLFRSLTGADRTGTIEANYGTNLDFATWTVEEICNVDTGGSNGSAAVVQSITGTISATALTLTLPGAYGNANNRPWGIFAYGQAFNGSPESGWTEVDDSAATPASVATVFRDNTGDLSATYTFSGGTSAVIGILLEVKAPVATTIGGRGRLLLMD